MRMFLLTLTLALMALKESHALDCSYWIVFFPFMVYAVFVGMTAGSMALAFYLELKHSKHYASRTRNH